MIKRGNLTNKEEAAAYLKVALGKYEEEGDHTAFLLALRNVAKAQGGMEDVAKNTESDRAYLYTVLSKKGNPRLSTLDPILRAMGLRLSIEAV